MLTRVPSPISTYLPALYYVVTGALFLASWICFAVARGVL